MLKCNAPNASHLFQIGYGSVDSGVCIANHNVLTVDTTGNLIATGTVTAPGVAAQYVVADAIRGDVISGTTVYGETITGNVLSSKTIEMTNSGAAKTFSGSETQGTLGKDALLLSYSLSFDFSSQDNDDVLGSCDKSNRGRMAIIEHNDRDYMCYCLKVGASAFKWICSH